jgi:ceramide glucosyltransferase
LACAAAPDWWPLAALAIALRAVAAWATSAWILKSPPRWHLLILQDFLSFFFWLAGFFGNTVLWRGRRYYLYPDGRFEQR